MPNTARKIGHSQTPELTLQAIRKGKAAWFSAAMDRSFRDLMRRMTSTLQDEDAQLAKTLDSGNGLGKEYRNRGAPGINYWVFEHNLVYSIFKGWAPRYRVLWDERAGAPWSKFNQNDRNEVANDNSKRRLIDLQVVTDKTGDTRWHFEVKWMNNPRGLDSAEGDVARLAKIRGKSGARCFVIGIWWNKTGELQHDLNFQRDWLSDQVSPVYSAAFTSIIPSANQRRVENGYVFLSVWEIITQ